MILTLDEESGFLNPQQCPLLWFFQVPPHVDQQWHKEPFQSETGSLTSTKPVSVQSYDCWVDLS